MSCEHCPWYDPDYGCYSPKFWECITWWDRMGVPREDSAAFL